MSSAKRKRGAVPEHDIDGNGASSRPSLPPPLLPQPPRLNCRLTAQTLERPLITAALPWAGLCLFARHTSIQEGSPAAALHQPAPSLNQEEKRALPSQSVFRSKRPQRSPPAPPPTNTHNTGLPGAHRRATGMNQCVHWCQNVQQRKQLGVVTAGREKGRAWSVVLNSGLLLDKATPPLAPPGLYHVVTRRGSRADVRWTNPGNAIRTPARRWFACSARSVKAPSRIHVSTPVQQSQEQSVPRPQRWSSAGPVGRARAHTRGEGGGEEEDRVRPIPIRDRFQARGPGADAGTTPPLPQLSFSTHHFHFPPASQIPSRLISAPTRRQPRRHACPTCPTPAAAAATALAVEVTKSTNDYRRPWQPSVQSMASGSGFAIRYTGPDGEPTLGVITNAHVVHDYSIIHVVKQGTTKKFQASLTPQYLAVDLDLALLTISDPSFWRSVPPLTYSWLGLGLGLGLEFSPVFPRISPTLYRAPHVVWHDFVKWAHADWCFAIPILCPFHLSSDCPPNSPSCSPTSWLLATRPAAARSALLRAWWYGGHTVPVLFSVTTPFPQPPPPPCLIRTKHSLPRVGSKGHGRRAS